MTLMGWSDFAGFVVASGIFVTFELVGPAVVSPAAAVVVVVFEPLVLGRI